MEEITMSEIQIELNGVTANMNLLVESLIDDVGSVETTTGKNDFPWAAVSVYARTNATYLPALEFLLGAIRDLRDRVNKIEV